jgi:hypothetical protein
MPATQTPSRDSILADPDALNCTIYRAHESYVLLREEDDEL